MPFSPTTNLGLFAHLRALGVVVAAAGLCACFSGCAGAGSTAKVNRLGPTFAPKNFTAVERLPENIRRVAVLPAAGLEGFPAEFGAEQEAMIASSLGATRRFEVVVIDRAQMRTFTGRPTLNSTAEWPAGFLEQIARETAADAVLFTDFTSFQPYPPVAIGVRTKLIQIGSGDTILWALDEVFDSTDASVARAARRHAGGGTSGALAEVTVLQSPTRFAAYVWSAAFYTLPVRLISR